MDISTDDVEVSFTAGAWSAHWPATGVRVGPMVAGAELDTGEVTSAGARGQWTTEAEVIDGRPGTTARWTPERAEGISVTLHVADRGGLLTVTAGITRAARLRRLRPFTGGFTVPGDGPVQSLVSGYDSWDWAGVQLAEGASRSWWSGLWTRGPDQPALAVHATPSRRLTTSYTTSQNAMRTLSVGAVAGGTPGMWFEGPMRFGHGDPEPLDLDAAGGVSSEPVVLASAADPFDALESVAAASGLRRAWPEPVLHGWASWYHFGSKVTPDDVLRHVGYTPPGSVVQIDDGWEVSVGDWQANERFAEITMAGLARAITDAGRRPGLWLAPFRVAAESPLATEHPDWLLEGGFGPMPDLSLDASHPDARAWLRQLGETVRGWGYDMVKLDFLSLGATESTARHDPTVTGLEALRLGLEAMVEGLGPDVYVLGCGMPLGVAPGLVHANRIGMDLDGPVADDGFRPFPAGEVMTGIRPVVRNTAARWFTAALFAPDPDVVMAYAPWYSLDQARLLAVIAAVAGGPYLLGDDFDVLPPEQRAVLEDARTLAQGAPFRPLDLFSGATLDEAGHRGFYQPGADPPSVWALTQPDGTSVVALCNWSDETRRIEVAVPPGTATELWTGDHLDVTGAAVALEVPATGVRVVRVAP